MAIKVNGTTVINDSRALTNIASLDATTVAAIGAAGVGGATSLITDWTTVSTNASYLEISLTGDYDAITIELRQITVAGSYTDLEIRIRFKDSSGNTINGNNMYKTVGGNNDTNNDTSFINGTGGEFYSTGYVYTGEANTRLTVRNHRDYENKTDYNIDGFVRTVVGSTPSDGVPINGYGSCIHGNNPSKAVFFITSGNTGQNARVFASGAQYRVYGVKL